MRLSIVISLCVISHIHAQETAAGYHDILRNAFGLPPEMRVAIAEKSGKAISFRENSMIMYRPIAQTMVKGNMPLTASLIPGIQNNFFKQIEWLRFLGIPYDGPNYQGIAIKSIHHATTQSNDDYDPYGGNVQLSLESEIILFDIASGKIVANKLIPDIEIAEVAIAPENNHIVAYASKLSSGGQAIYWADLKNGRNIEIGTLSGLNPDGRIRRLQFYNANKLYVLSNAKLHLFDITESGATISNQTPKDEKGNELVIDDFTLNKTDSNLAAAIMNSGLYILNMKTKKFKKINELPETGHMRRLAFSDNQIGIITYLGGEVNIVVIEPGLYSIAE